MSLILIVDVYSAMFMIPIDTSEIRGWSSTIYLEKLLKTLKLLKLMYSFDLFDGSIGTTAQNLCKPRKIDVAAGDDADDLSGAGFAVERARDRAGAGAFGDDVVARD